MNRDEMIIRFYEVVITIGSSYLAINSFFASSLYGSISQLINGLLATFNIQTVSTAQVSQIVPMLVSAIVFLIVIYDYAIGKPENMIDIYEINLVLITPEVLSFSRLNWLNLIEKPQVLEPTRGPTAVFLTGAVILVGYLSLLFTSRFKETVQELSVRGAEDERIQGVFTKQSTITIGLVLLSALSSIILFAVNPIIKAFLSPALSGIRYGYLYLGILAVFTFTVSVFYYYNEQGSMDDLPHSDESLN
ncbi:hypothetical protein JXL21_13000 [Candidatus Bathyarchaeota archaeon]|nr:hypothetical protein [Candidatus Bathyarchaeota archaeon]